MIGSGYRKVSSRPGVKCSFKAGRLTEVWVPDALYDLLVIEASHVDQIMSQLATTSPMA
jgi:hypothetical protein